MTGNTEPQYASRVGKKITAAQARYAQWLRENTGYDVDERSVALALALMEPHKKSDEHKTAMARRREEMAAELEEKARRLRSQVSGSTPAPEPRKPRWTG